MSSFTAAWGSERKISFALGGIEKIGEREKERGAGDDDSQHSSNTELNNMEQEERKGKAEPELPNSLQCMHCAVSWHTANAEENSYSTSQKKRLN